MNRLAQLWTTLLTASVLLFGTLATSPCLALSVPGVQLDGTLGDAEWAGSVHFELSDQRKVLVRSTTHSIDVGLRGFPTGEFGFGCLFVAVDDQVHVLHASAQLGTATYFEQDGLWNPLKKTYDWKPAETLWREDGWRSHPSKSNGNQEFQISRRLAPADQRISIAVGYVTIADKELQASGWHESLDDDTRNTDLLAGHNPESLRFAVSSWYHLDPPGAELPAGWDREEITQASYPSGHEGQVHVLAWQILASPTHKNTEHCLVLKEGLNKAGFALSHLVRVPDAKEPAWTVYQTHVKGKPGTRFFPGAMLNHGVIFDQRPTREQVYEALEFTKVNWEFEPESSSLVVESGMDPAAWESALAEH